MRWIFAIEAKLLAVELGSSGSNGVIAFPIVSPSPDQATTSAKQSMAARYVRREKAALSSGCKTHPANARAESNRSSHGGNEVAEAFDYRVTNW
jgi:hypothetical protein